MDETLERVLQVVNPALIRQVEELEDERDLLKRDIISLYRTIELLRDEMTLYRQYFGELSARLQQYEPEQGVTMAAQGPLRYQP